jgi:hypothetical protein
MPDPESGSTSKNFCILTNKIFLSSRKYDPGCSSRIRILIFYPSLIPDQGVKKAPDPGFGSATLVVMHVYLYARTTALPGFSPLGVFQAYKVMSTEVEGGGQSQLFKDYYAHNTNGRQAGSLISRFSELVSFTLVIWEISHVLRFENGLPIEFFTLSVGCERVTEQKWLVLGL